MRDIPSIQELPDYDGTPSGNLINFNALNNDLNGSYHPRGNTTLIQATNIDKSSEGGLPKMIYARD